MLITAYLRQDKLLIKFFSLVYPASKHLFSWMKELKGASRNSSILDVGSGNGQLLLELKKLGFTNLQGIDPFIERDIDHGDGLKIHKQEIFSVTNKFDIVMLHHSFEHMEEPHKILQKISEITKYGGYLIIRIPVVDSYAWRTYGVNWYQVDAPRHFFVYTKKTLIGLVQKYGLSPVASYCDSTALQFTISDAYAKNQSFGESDSTNPSLLKKFRRQAIELNNQYDGDQACFVFQKQRTDVIQQ